MKNMGRKVLGKGLSKLFRSERAEEMVVDSVKKRLLSHNHQTYKKSLLKAWKDGEITDEERDILKRLRDILGISLEDHSLLQEEVFRQLGIETGENVDVGGIKDRKRFEASKDQLDQLRVRVRGLESFDVELDTIKKELPKLQELLLKEEYDDLEKGMGKLEEDVEESEVHGRFLETLDKLNDDVKKTFSKNVPEDIRSELDSIAECGEQKNYEECETRIKDLQENVSNLSRAHKYRKDLEKLGKDLDKLEKKGVDVSSDRITLEGFLQRVDKLALRGIKDEINDFKRHLKSTGKQREAMAYIEMTEEVLDRARSKNLDMEPLQAQYDEMKGLLDRGKYTGFQRRFKKVERTYDELKSRQEVANAIIEAETFIGEAENLGIRVSDAKAEIRTAKRHMNGKRFKTALQTVERALKFAQNAKLRHLKTNAEETIDATRLLIKNIQEYGDIDVKEAENLVSQAENMIEEKHFGQAVSTAKQAELLAKKQLEDAKNRYQEDRAKTSLKMCGVMLDEARNLEINVKSQAKSFEKAQTVFENGDFSKAKKMADEVQERIRTVKQKHFENAYEMLQVKIDPMLVQVGKEGGDIDREKIKLEKTEILFKDGEVEQAYRELQLVESSLVASLSTIQRGRVETKLVETDKLLEDLKNLGLETAELHTMVERANLLLEQGDVEGTRNITQRVLADAMQKRTDYLSELYPFLSVQLPNEGLQADEWNRYVFQVTNEGKAPAENVSIDMLGDFEVKGLDKIDRLDVGETREVEVGIKPKVSGPVDVSLNLDYGRPLDSASVQTSETMKVDIRGYGSYVVEDIFLIYHDGCLMIHEGRKLQEDLDQDIFTGMLMAVQDFVSDSFQRGAKVGLKRLDFGDNKILIEKGKFVVLATTITGEEPGLLPLYMIETIAEMEMEFGKILEGWNGKISTIEVMRPLVRKLLNVETSDEARQGMLSGSNIAMAHAILNEGRTSGVDVTDVETLLDDLEEIILTENLDKAIEDLALIQDVTQTATRKVKMKKTEDMIVEATGKLGDAKDWGSDVAEAEALLKEAQGLLDSDDFENAHVVAERASGQAREIHHGAQVQRVNRTREDIEEVMRSSQELGLDVTDAEKMLAEVEMMLKEDSLDEALSNLEKLGEGLQNDRNQFYGDKASETLLASQAELAQLKEEGLELDDAWGLLTEAESLFEEKRFEEAHKIAQEVGNKARDVAEEFYDKQSRSQLESLRSTVDGQRRLGLALKGADELMKEAEELRDKKRFKDALDKLEDLRRKVDMAASNHVEKNIKKNMETMSANVREFKRFGVDVSMVENTLAKAQTAMEEGDVGKVEKLLDRGQNEFSLAKRQYFATQAEKTIQKVRTNIKKGKKEGVDMSEAVTLLKAAQKHFEDEEFDKLEEALDRAEKTSVDLRIKSLSDRVRVNLSELQDEVKKGADEGANMKDAEDLLAEAEKLFAEEEFETAMAKLDEVKVKAETSKKANLEERTTRQLENAQSRLEESKKAGIEMNEVEDLLSQAEIMFQEEDFENVEAILAEAEKRSDDARNRYIQTKTNETINRAQRVVLEAQQRGMNVSEHERNVARAQELFKQNNFNEAEKLVNSTVAEVQTLLAKEAGMDYRESLDSVQEMAMKAREEGIPLDDVDDLLVEAEQMFVDTRWEDIENVLTDAQGHIQTVRREHYEQVFSDASQNMRITMGEIKDEGGEIDEMEKLIMEAEGLLKEDRFDEVQQLMDTAQRQANGTLNQIHTGKALDLIKQAESAISEGESAGIDVTHSQEYLTKSQDLLAEGGNPRHAVEYAQLAMDDILDRRRFQETRATSQLISSTETLLDTMKAFGVDVSNAEEQLINTKQALEEGDIRNVEDNVNNIRSILDEIREPYRAQMSMNSIMNLQAKIVELSDTGTDVSDIEQILSDAKMSFERNQLDALDEAIVKGEQLLNERKARAMKDKLVSRRTEVEEEMSKTAELGANVESAMQEFMRSDSLRDQDRIEEAVESLETAQQMAARIRIEFLKERATSALDEAQKTINATLNTGADLKDPMHLLEQARESMDSEDYTSAFDFALNSTEMARQLGHAAVKKTLTSEIRQINSQMEQLKSFGGDITELKKELAGAVSAIKSDDMERSQEAVQKARESLERASEPHMQKLAENMMVEARALVSKIGSTGVDVVDAEARIHQADGFLSATNYQGAIRFAKEAQEVARNLHREHRRQQLERELAPMKKRIDHLQDLGYFSPEAMDLISRFNARLDKEDFKGAKSLLAPIKEKTVEREKQMVQENARDVMNFSLSLVKYLKNNVKAGGKDLKRAEILIKKSRDAYNKKDYHTAHRLASKSRSEVENIKNPRLIQFMFVFQSMRSEEEAGKINQQLRSLEKEGLDVSAINEEVVKAKKLMDDSSHFKEGEKVLSDIKIKLRKMDNDLTQKKSEKGLTRAQSLMISARRKGEDVTAVEGLLEKARSALNDKDFKKADFFTSKAMAQLNA